MTSVQNWLVKGFPSIFTALAHILVRRLLGAASRNAHESRENLGATPNQSILDRAMEILFEKTPHYNPIPNL